MQLSLSSGKGWSAEGTGYQRKYQAVPGQERYVYRSYDLPLEQADPQGDPAAGGNGIPGGKNL